MNRRLACGIVGLTAVLLFATAFQDGAATRPAEPGRAVSMSGLSVVPSEAQRVAWADPKDVETIDGIVAALYDVISGGPGVKRNWNRERSLMRPTAMLTAVVPRRSGGTAVVTMTDEEYIARSGPYMEEKGFFEREIARRTERFGSIATVFSTYASRHAAADENPFERGINSVQLVHDGTRWWITGITWDSESTGNVLPPEYLQTVASRPSAR